MVTAMDRTLPPATDAVEMALARRLLADGTARKTRIRNGLSLADMAGPAGITPATLWRWEQGRRVPRTSEALLRYGQLLGQLLDLGV